MSEMFKLGTNRIVYQSSDFAEGKTVKASIYTPTATEWASGNLFSEISQGIYYLDYNFAIAGSYIVKFAENGEAMTTSTYRVWDIDTDLDSVYNNSKIISSNVAFVKNVESGRWLRSGSQMKLYKDDNVTLIATFNLKTSGGTAAGVANNVFERVVA
jgi:hypothetical protein